MPIALLDERDKAELQEQIDNSANAIKKTASGSLVALSDISPLEHILRVKARSENMYPTLKEQTDFGVTLTINDNKFVILNGECTGNGNFTIENCVCTQTGTYYLCDFAEGIFPTTPHLRTGITNISNNETVYTSQNGASNQVASIKMNKGDTYTLRVQVRAGHKYENCILKPMMCFEKSPTSFIPPIDVSTAKLQRCGKNFYDGTVDAYLQLDGSGDNRVAINSATPQGKIIKVLPNTDYSFSGDFSVCADGRLRVATFAELPTINSVGLQFFHSATSFSIKTADNADYLFVYIIVPTQTNNINIQCEVGTAATEFEPHKEPTTYSINADGTVEGVTSLYPTTTLMSDTEGVVFDVGYNVDTKKYIDSKIESEIAKLAAAIINS